MTPTQSDMEHSREALFGVGRGGDKGDHDVLYGCNVLMIAGVFARLREAHDARVTELLDANNRFEKRARAAERTVETMDNAMRQMVFHLGGIGRERDELARQVAHLESYSK